MRSSTVRVLLLTSLLAAAPAPGAGPRSGLQASDDVARRLCDALQGMPETRRAACCGTSASRGMADACTRELGHALREGAVTIERRDVDRCAAESSSALAGCGWVTPYLPRVPAGCRAILHGQRTAGGRCRSSLECRDGLRCVGRTAEEPGVCVPPGAPGASCGGVPDGLTTYARQTDDRRHPECAGYCLRGRCAAFVAPGGTCGSDAQCAPGSHCEARRCVARPPPALGERCDGATCTGDLVCRDGRCAPPRKAGESCSRPFECEGACLSAPAGTPGVCGMRCSAWPPAGYTPPHAGPSVVDVPSSRGRVVRRRRD